MNNLTNFFKNRRNAMIIPTIALITIAIIILFTTVTLSHFKNITENENDVLTLGASELAGNIVVSSDDFLFVVASDVEEKTEEEQAVDDEQDKEEEKKAEEEAKKQEEKTTAPVSYYIKINRSANAITVYTTDANGNYTVPVKSMICSTGYASPTGGIYSTKKIGTWHTLFGGVYGQYCTQITGNILFHSVPYLRRGDNSSLEYWAYDRLGTTASAGCVRLTTADAQWIYYNCNNGTKVEFYSSATPGPLGKPTATKISAESSPYKNWDPTDPNPNNPWRNKPASTTTTQVQNTTDVAAPSNNNPSSNNPSGNNTSSVTITSIDNNTKQNDNSSNGVNTNKTTNTNTNIKPNTNINTNTKPNTNTNSNTNTNTNANTNTNTNTNFNTNTNTNTNSNINAITNNPTNKTSSKGNNSSE